MIARFAIALGETVHALDLRLRSLHMTKSPAFKTGAELLDHVADNVRIHSTGVEGCVHEGGTLPLPAVGVSRWSGRTMRRPAGSTPS
jgi:hypothetical protein